MRLLLFFLCWLSTSCLAQATHDLLIISSQRNAQTIAEAARLFYQAYPDSPLKISARTDNQFSKLTEQERRKLIEESHSILGLGLYGLSVELLKGALKNSARNQLFVSSDHRLITLSQFSGKRIFKDKQKLNTIVKTSLGNNFEQDLAQQLKTYPQQAPWLRARAYWQAGESENTMQFFSWMLQHQGAPVKALPPKPVPRLRWYIPGKSAQYQTTLDKNNLGDLDKNTPTIAIIDHAGGSRASENHLTEQLCQRAETLNIQCLIASAYWGEAGVEAVKQLANVNNLTAIVMLQDFVIGAGEGRSEASQYIAKLNVPVLKAIKIRDRTMLERRLSADGIDREKVYYQVAMPELQGVSQPVVIAALGQSKNDSRTGIRMQGLEADDEGINLLLARIHRWQKLQVLENREKRVAIVYYNHPPGRHNIGADNLDVPASLWQILNQLKRAGYNTGDLPESQQALLDLMQLKGVNLPNDAKALEAMHHHTSKLSLQQYNSWFKTLPASVQQEITHGPLGLLHQQLNFAIDVGMLDAAHGMLEQAMEELHHLLEGVDHQGRERVLALLQQLEECYQITIDQQRNCIETAPKLIGAIAETGIEGLGGWGNAPGKVMTYKEEFLLPGLQFGNVFIGPQPPRGWEVNEELLHANLAFPPTHQYLAFYHYLQESFKADAIIHLGRHSTYEFLPRRSVGLMNDDYSQIIAGDIPGIYPYIVDGIGEGIQAKRRGLAVMIDHLTPPLAITPLYDELLQLRQLVESFEANHDNPLIGNRLIVDIREKIETLELKEELAEAMSGELSIMGISFEQVDDDMLVHEIGHYLTDLQERFMPLGLHVYGKNWNDDATKLMIQSMFSNNENSSKVDKARYKKLLQESPKAEMESLLNALSGGFVQPGQGNDPIRSPESLPTGRNFYALDSSLIPSRLAWQLGKEMAENARKNNPQNADKKEAVILWASDVVRDEGVMIAFSLDMLGLEPIWNSRGLVKGLRHQKEKPKRVRRDVLFTTSGLFRDLYGQQLKLLDGGVLMALDASADIIRQDYPALNLALSEALKPLGKHAQGGKQPLTINQVAAHWVEQTRELLAQNILPLKAGKLASLRIFGDAPGAYGAGINRLVERSGAWQHRQQLAEVYMRRLGYSYGINDFGESAQAMFKQSLTRVENTYLGRSSNLYGLLDNNDAFDYLGGLSLAVETLTGEAPNNYVLDHSNTQRISAKPLASALRQELRGRFLNPSWLRALMKHGYAGARTMGSEFIEYLWGWQVTNPNLVGDWAWEEVKAIYIDDKYELGLNKFLEQGHNVHVKANILAVMLVAIQKEFWQASPETINQLSSKFVELVKQNGLPGSGHTDPHNPMLAWLKAYLPESQWKALEKIIDESKVEGDKSLEVHRITEINISKDEGEKGTPNTDSEKQDRSHVIFKYYWLILIGIFSVIAAGFYVGRRRTKRLNRLIAMEGKD